MADMVSDERCEVRRKEVFGQIGCRLTSKVFWSLFGLVALGLSVVGGWTLSHTADASVHLHPDYAPATKHEFDGLVRRTGADIREIQRDIKDIEKTQRQILLEIRRGNGHRVEGP